MASEDKFQPEEPNIIIDNGSGFMKAGLTSDDKPRCVFPTIVGKFRKRYEMADGSSPVFVGDQALFKRHELSFRRPIDHGHIDEWTHMEEIWNYTFSCLDTDPQSRGVLVTIPPLCSSQHYYSMTQILFESFAVREINIAVSGLLAAYGTGRTTGLVLDIGEGVTQIVPVYEGYLQKSSIRRSDFGGEELTLYLRQMLSDIGYPVTTRDDYEHIRIMKESLCYCSKNPAEEESRNDLEVTYVLPDGYTLRDGHTSHIRFGPERYYVAEAFFDPQLCGRDNQPLCELLWDSLKSCQIELRKSLLGNLVLSGGSTLFRGFGDRLEIELKSTVPPQARSFVKVLSEPEREFLPWTGGRICGSPSMRRSQDDFWITCDDWNECGESIFTIKSML